MKTTTTSCVIMVLLLWIVGPGGDIIRSTSQKSEPRTVVAAAAAAAVAVSAEEDGYDHSHHHHDEHKNKDDKDHEKERSSQGLGGVEKVLEKLTADISSPLSAEPDVNTEATLDNIDEKLREFEKEQRLVLCFDVTQKHYITHRAAYVEQARMSSRQLNMRDDEAMRLMFHGSLVACYSNLREKDVDHYAQGKLTEQDENRILMRHPDTPTRFSTNQMKLLEKIVASTQDGSTAGFATISGWMGQVYLVVVVFIIFSLLYFGYRRLAAMRQGKSKKSRMTDRKSVV